MNDLISRQEALKTYQKIVCKGICCYDCRAVDRDGNCVVEDWLKALPSAQQWISCSERLPNVDGNYIVTLSYTEGFKFSFVDIDNFSAYERQWDIYGSDVTAWMLLPEPYEKG